MQVTERGYAKINLSLDVLRRRDDGYHEVRMIMQTVDLFDTLDFERIPEDRIELTTDSDILADMEGNLVSKAAKAFKKRFSIDEGIRVSLKKKIPIAAGLAGGSADAAATLRAMNRLFDVNAENSVLCEIAGTLGADVPFCVCGGTMLSEGIGEVLTPVKSGLKAHCVIVKPDFPMPTKYVYNNLVLDEKIKHPDIRACLSAVADGNLYRLAEVSGNVLESVSCKLHPEIAEIKNVLERLGASFSLMSGSGPSVFALFEDYDDAKNAFDTFSSGKYGAETFLTGLR
ncbi:MAG: 4-(cytidine 5'-diphospho)-2-C-methyl-D-erythritol kinase [Lachnospiraceae bacterium]|nr:4-(cytidine 5'-diphospho)-2-C-methyl-D-erythritol kinase [Lachnospiraceae bacterium]MBP5183522.1 4-(cytidine 5'-diphospho)-2-C-methyl-D-erythritol kinase [Lachnospiraceae bacterium]